MFKKILIVEDIDSIALGLTALLEKKFRAKVHSTRHCDEGYMMLKNAQLANQPFDLVITDLSFKEANHEPRLKSGEELIAQIREEKLSVRILVYSVEDKPYLIRSLFLNNRIDGFVAKGRDSTTELIDAVKALSKGDLFIAPQLANLLKDQPVFDLDKYDVEILKLLSEGMTQDDISYAFKKNDYPSPSTSSIEKRINRLKVAFKANNGIQLVAIAKDMRLI